ncbi:hypothetical protein GCM10009785_21910 [Brooklawnia cerclae]|uniref:LPXTG-motif cell wall-anchored protein n=1 Tax=Brooklawnia cerclae TaxID=349934 RepID=A0ABX0SKF4_9ACTN|nr:LPXTG cell wall anchor domain-containing protein [Brooklawnia cerclae]NIH57176.1 LPXTG-motif cell wall-anchored protein [Brooklawnia cerclae]
MSPQSTDWILTADGPVTASGVTGDPLVTDTAVEPGSYTLSEAPVADRPTAEYVSEGWSCTGAELDGDVLVLGVGDDVTCTVTNRAEDEGTAPPDHQDRPWSLPATGGDSLGWLAGGAAILLLGSALIGGSSRKRR